MPAKTSLVGRTFTRWFVVAPGPNYQSWCQCSCGNTTTRIVRNASLLRGASKSCGCLKIERFTAYATRHGQARDGARSYCYKCWQDMRNRSTNPNFQQAKDYVERGIGCCPEWKEFEPFFAFMGTGKKGWTVDRVNNDAGYYPENVVWATRTFQLRHTRRSRIFTVLGITACASELCERFKISSSALYGRLRRGWSVERAFTEPLG